MKTEYIESIKSRIGELRVGYNYTYSEICFYLDLPYKPKDTGFKKQILNQLDKLITYEYQGKKLGFLILSNDQERKDTELEKKMIADGKDYYEHFKKTAKERRQEDLDDITVLYKAVKRNLRVGNVYTYKEICLAIGADYDTRKNGNSKPAFLKKLSRCVEYVKEGTEYRILKIFKCPLPKVNKLRKDAIYTYYISNLLLYYLYNEHHGSSMVVHSQAMWWYLLGITNIKYLDYRRGIHDDGLMAKAARESVYLRKEVIEHFFYTTASKFRTIFNNALKDLNKRRYLYFAPVYVGVDRKTGKKQVITNSKEISEILEIDAAALEECGGQSRDELIYNDLLRKKYNVIHRQMIHNKTKWKMVYTNVAVIQNENRIKKNLDVNSENLEKMIENFNKAILKYMKTFSENNMKKVEAKPQKQLEEELGYEIQYDYSEISPIDRKEMEMFAENYISEILFLSDETIKISDIPDLKKFPSEFEIYLDELRELEESDDLDDYLPIDINFE